MAFTGRRTTHPVGFPGKVRASDAIVYSLALIAVAAFNLVSANRIAPWVYLGVTLVMLILTGRIRLFSVDNRFLEYRCLAEALRTLFFWRRGNRATGLGCLFVPAGGRGALDTACGPDR